MIIILLEKNFYKLDKTCYFLKKYIEKLLNTRQLEINSFSNSIKKINIFFDQIKLIQAQYLRRNGSFKQILNKNWNG